MLYPWKHAESHKQFLNLSELIQILVYFITLCPYNNVLSFIVYRKLRAEKIIFHVYSFSGLKAYCSIQMSSIPMTFVLGFYVSLIVKRWWDQYNLLPWPDSLAIYIAGKVIIKKSRGEVSLMEQDTIENVS